MMYYHCMNEHCGKTFRGNRARICPCCGGRVLRHAMGYEIERLETERPVNRVFPLILPTVPVAGLAG